MATHDIEIARAPFRTHLCATPSVLSSLTSHQPRRTSCRPLHDPSPRMAYGSTKPAARSVFLSQIFVDWLSVQNSSFPEEDTPVYIPAANPDVFLAERIAHFLCKAFSIGADGLYKDFVVVCSSGQPAAPVAFWGIIVAGGVLRAASHSLTPEELARQMKQGKSRGQGTTERRHREPGQSQCNDRSDVGCKRDDLETMLTAVQDPVTAMPRGSSAATDSISPVMPNMEPRIVDYCDIKPGQPGKTMVRGPFVTNGWDGHPEATQSTFRNGSFLTGDMAIETRGKLSTLSIGRRN
ncbi:hypothetical protein DPSP01_001615 [Paraphaeosphaeria sporulosa]